MFLVVETMVINSIWVNRNNNIFDNLDYKPKNEIKDLSELIKLV